MEIRVFSQLPGDGEKLILTDIYSSDENYFLENNFNVSIEIIPNNRIVLYSTIGLLDNNGEEIQEMLLVSADEDSKFSMSKLRKLVEEKRKEYLIKGFKPI